jgi:signal transduction histidine kinase
LVQALRHMPAGPMPESLRRELFRRVLQHPSFLTPALIDAAEGVSSDPQTLQPIQILKRVWLMQEKTRTLLRSLAQHPPSASQRATETWVEVEGRMFLAQCRPVSQPNDEYRSGQSSGSGYDVALLPGSLLEQEFQNALETTREGLPPWMAASVMLGERRWPFSHGLGDNGNQVPMDELASISRAVQVRPDLPDFQRRPYLRGGELEYFAPPEELTLRFTLLLELANPDLLYASYRRRLWLSAGLILMATAAAGIGLAGAWRAFQRQLRLAEMTSNFVSSVSHELRAPLASVRLMAESLDQDRIADEEKRKNYFRLIVQECRRLSSLVENVLDFSRIRQERKQYEFEPVDLSALLRRTVSLMEPVAAERRVSLNLLEPDSGIGDLQAFWDGQAVKQALVNLIDNAVKHSPDGAVVMVRYAAEKTAAGSFVRISVEDRGQGIPAAEQNRIFEPFFRRGSELRRETRGIGIGLSIVKHIAEAHGGRVRVESRPEQGSRFILELPLRMEPPPRGTNWKDRKTYPPDPAS